MSWTSAFIHVLNTPELWRRVCVTDCSSPDLRSQSCRPQSREVMDTELAHSSAPRRTMEPVYPFVQSAMQNGKQLDSLKVSMQLTSICSLLQSGRTQTAAWATGEDLDPALGDV